MNVKHIGVGNKHTLGALSKKSDIFITLSEEMSYNPSTFYLSNELAEELVNKLQEVIEFNKTTVDISLL